MDKSWKTHLLILILFATQTTLAAPLSASPTTTASDNSLLESQQFSFVNNRNVTIRDTNLQNPQIIPAFSSITLDPRFVLETFRTAAPTREQIQRLFMNPGEFYGRVDARTFTDSSGSRHSEYFFPVIVRTQSGHIRTGEMSLFNYNRLGYVELQNQPPLAAPPLTQGTAVGCGTCAPTPPPQTSDIADVLAASQRNSRASLNPLWAKFSEFAKDFTRRNPRISRSQAGYYKRLYVKEMVDKFGAQEAGKILTAVTGFAESPYRTGREVQIAETAAIIKVINNRANNRYRVRSRTLRDIGVAENADAHLVNVLADWQFSVWNERDNSLLRILQLNPDTADRSTMHRLTAAFDAQHLMNSNRIQFLGRMNQSDLHHYHANYVAPNWMQPRSRVQALVKVGNDTINLGQQRGAMHIFYAGVP